MVFNINTNELTPFDREVRKKTDYTPQKNRKKNQSSIIKYAQ